MAEIPVEKKSSLAWLWILLAILLLGLLLWWAFDDDEVEPVAAGVPGIGEVAGTPEGPITTIEAILAAQDPTALVGRAVRLDSVQVQAVPDDRAFLVGPSRERSVLVMLNENATPNAPVEGQVDVNPGQVVNVVGTIRSAADLGNNPEGLKGMITGQDVYIQSSQVEIVSAAPGGMASGAGAPANAAAVAEANRRTAVEVDRNPAAPPRVFYAFDSAELTAEAKAVLDRVVERRRAELANGITLVGFADRAGPKPYNRELSARRAQAARDYLVSKGVAANLIETEAEGEMPPLVETGDGVRNPRNRRVRIEVGDAPSA